MRVVTVAVKGLKETWRDKRSLAFLMLFPLMFIMVFRMAFGWGVAENETYTIAVLDMDEGEGPWDHHDPPWMAVVNAGMSANLTGQQFFDQLVLNGSASAADQFASDFLGASMYEDGKTRLFEVRTVGSAKRGEQLVKDGDVAALVIIPANFSSAVMGTSDAAGVEEVRAHSIPVGDPLEGYANASVDVRGVQGDMDYSFCSAIVESIVRAYHEATTARVRAIVGSFLPGGPAESQGTLVQGAFVSMGEKSELVAFDFIAPGLLVFGLMMTTMFVSSTLSMEVDNHTLDRLRLTKMGALDMMGGETARWMVIGVFQVLVLFGAVVAVGTHFEGTPGEVLPYAILIGLCVVLASVALALVISSFVDDPEQASNLGTMLVVPLSFLTGAFFDLQLPGIEYLPWSQGSTAMRHLLIYNDLDAAMGNTLICLVGGVVLFIAGALIFHYKRLRGV
jgi:ABC-2 type transport system permease protein